MKITTSKRFIHKHRYGLTIFSSVFLFIFASCGLVVANGQTIRPDDSHIVNVMIDGHEEIIPTRAQTVGDFVAKLPVRLKEADVVEPDVKTEIDNDNFKVRILRASPTTIIDGNNQISLLSPYDDARQAVERAGIELAPEDIVRQEFASDILATRILGRKLVIDRATSITVNLYGSPFEQKTRLKTVQEVLDLMSIKPVADDTVQPSLDTVLTEGMRIFITKFGKQVITVESAIPRGVEYVMDGTLSFGASVVREEGHDGKKASIFEITTTNGAETSRKLIQETIVEKPLGKVVARGQIINVAENKRSIMASAGIAESDFGYVDYIISRESGWCATKWQGQVGICPDYYQEKFPGAETMSSLGFGLCQATPASKMATAGADWRTNPVTQLRWCSSYAVGRYGSWASAYESWVAKNWW